MAVESDTASTLASPAVAVVGVTLGYGLTPVLAQTDLTVENARVAAVLGPSGSGKTTLLRAVAGFIRPSAGSITLSGTVVSGDSTYLPPEKRNVGLVPQEGALFPHLNVAGNVGFGLPRRSRAQRLLADERIEELLDLVSLPGTQKLSPHQLSGGMQQRVALARALARRPQTVLLDEPFSALDSQLRSELRLQVRELLVNLGAGVILVTHDEDEAVAMADDIYTVTPHWPAKLVRREADDPAAQ
ncbi:MAG: ABC transporter ATP-binding protein [Candidatus Nanopelagicales bacterium]